MLGQNKYWDSDLAKNLDQIRVRFKQDRAILIKDIEESLNLYGFTLVSGIGLDSDRRAITNELLSVSAALGTILPQSPRYEKIEDIRDFSDIDEKDDRGYRSKGELTPHSDPPTLIVLHCLQSAKSGGESYLVNVRAIHNAIQNCYPDLLNILYQDFPFWRVEGQTGGPGPSHDLRPIFRMLNNEVSCVYYRPFVEKAATASGIQLSTDQTAALDIFDQYANSPEFALRFYLNPDETLILHNRTVLHARTDYEDWSDPDQRRHLLRVWIDAPELLPVASDHELGNLFGD